MDAISHRLAQKTDGELLAAHLGGDGLAFEVLAARHSGMVMGVTSSILGEAAEAQDAAQATFVTLARKAGSLRGHPSVAGWLHRVARYVALRAREARAIRVRHEQEAARMKGEDHRPLDGVVAREDLHAALDALPEKYRAALILHHLEGRTQEEIAALTGEKVGTVSSWLTRGREKLRRVLSGKGAAVSAVGLSGILAAEGQAAAGVTVGFEAAAASPQVALLADGAVRMLYVAKMKFAAMAVACVVAIAGGGEFFTYAALQAEEPGGAMVVATTSAPGQAGVGVAVAATPVEIRGRVLGPNDQPLANLPVRVATSLYGSLNEVTVETDSSGIFSLPVHPQLSARLLSVRSREGLFVSEVSGSLPTSQRLPLLYADGKVSKDLTIRMTPGESEIGGVVTNGAGKPVKEARVSVYRYTNQYAEGTGQARYCGLNSTGESPSGHFTAQTDERGVYRVRLAPGVYSGCDAVGPENSYLATAPSWSLVTALRTHAGHVSDLPLTLQESGAVRLTVLDESNRPLSRISPRLFSTGPRAVSMNVGGVVTNEQGVVVLGGIPAGTYKVMALAGKNLDLQSGESADVAVELSRSTEVTLRLKKNAARKKEEAVAAATLRGRVVDLASKGIGGVKLTVVTDESITNAAAAVGEVVTSADGEFAISGVRGKTAFVTWALPRDSELAISDLEQYQQVRGQPFNPHIAVDQSRFGKPLVLTFGPAVVARVKFAPEEGVVEEAVSISTSIAAKWSKFSVTTGAPLELAKGAGTMELRFPRTLTRAAGKGESLESVSIVLTPMNVGPIPGTAQIKLDVGKGVEQFTCTLQKGGDVEGVVLDADGKALANAAIVPWGVDEKGKRNTYGFQNYLALADAAGRYRLKNLADGEYDLEILVQDGRNLCAPVEWPRVTVKAGTTVEAAAIRAIAGASIEGRVVDSKGKRVAGTLQIRRAGESRFMYDRIERHATTQRDFRIARLAPGKYVVGVYLTDEATGATPGPSAVSEDPVEVKLGEALKWEVELEEGRAVKKEGGAGAGGLP